MYLYLLMEDRTSLSDLPSDLPTYDLGSYSIAILTRTNFFDVSIIL